MSPLLRMTSRHRGRAYEARYLRCGIRRLRRRVVRDDDDTLEGACYLGAFEILRLAFGTGAFVLPFVLVLIGFSFIIRFQRQKMPTRVAVGLFLVFLAVLGIMGVLTPGADISTIDKLFLKQNLLMQGGYVGAGIAWVGLMYLGLPVSVIVLSASSSPSMIIGFTINRLIDRVQAMRDRKKLQQASASQAAADQPVYSTGVPQRKGLFGRKNKQLPPGQAAPTIGGFEDMPATEYRAPRSFATKHGGYSSTRRSSGIPEEFKRHRCRNRRYLAITDTSIRRRGTPCDAYAQAWQ